VIGSEFSDPAIFLQIRIFQYQKVLTLLFISSGHHWKEKPVTKARQATNVTEESTEITLQVGCMVALRLQKYSEDIPQIAKVVKLTELDVTVEWWIGAYGDTWREWKERGRVITETFPRNAVIHHNIRFTKSLRLPKHLITELKDAYRSKELI